MKRASAVNAFIDLYASEQKINHALNVTDSWKNWFTVKIASTGRMVSQDAVTM